MPYDSPEKKRQWGLKNPGRQTREANRVSCQKWLKANRGAANALWAKRKALKLVQTCTCCTKEKFRAIYDVARMFGDEVDHIKALALGGLHCRHNLQLLSPQQHRLKTLADRAAIRLHKSLERKNVK
jgi:5-methylcytosine-specific restriction endonuclease McrA